MEGLTVSQLNNTAVNISWEPLTLVKARGFLQSYTVILTERGNIKKRNSPLFRTVPSSQSSVIFTGLHLDTTHYTASVFAETIAGLGQATSTVIGTATRTNTNNGMCTLLQYQHVRISGKFLKFVI